MEKIKLSIAIPTYNRRAKLEEAVNSVLPQILEVGTGLVELIIIDNCSTDDTASYLVGLADQGVRTFRNSINYGFDGNTIRCITESRGSYVALLSDDDKYADGLIKQILDLTTRHKYCLILLNYQSFGLEGGRVNYYAPKVDKVFQRAYDVMKYPSVGHFSGFIYKNNVASECLTEMLTSDPSLSLDQLALTTYKRRGVYLELAARTASRSSFPSYFLGKPYVLAREGGGLDVCSVQFGINKIREYSTDYYQYYKRLYASNVIQRDDFLFGQELAYNPLLRICILSIPHLTSNEAQLAKNELILCFERARVKKLIALLLLTFAKYSLFRRMVAMCVKTFR